jgi:hypothetical protein
MSIRSWKSKSRSKERCWSRDPGKNKSDWTLHISRESGNTDTYYVHTKVLDKLPPHRVPYFETIFKDNMNQIGDNESEINISDDAADTFSVLLDFLYCSTEKQEHDLLVNVKNGLALYKLAEYYNIRPLQEMLPKFYRDSTLAFNVIEFINEAKKFETSGMLDSAIEQFAHAMHTIEFIEEDQLEPEFLLRAMERRKALKLPMNRWDSENISCLIALCTKHYKYQLTRSLFYKLTHEDYIPFVDQEAAMQILTVEAELNLWSDPDNFSCVQGRCIRSLLGDWAGLRGKFESDSGFWKTLRKLSPSILGILLMHSTGTAHGIEEAPKKEIPDVQTVLST